LCFGIDPYCAVIFCIPKKLTSRKLMTQKNKLFSRVALSFAADKFNGFFGAMKRENASKK